MPLGMCKIPIATATAYAVVWFATVSVVTMK